MKADEIIKILRGCGNGMNTCVECSYYREKDPHECKFKAMYAATNLIKAQQQEIDRLRAQVAGQIIGYMVQDGDGRICRYNDSDSIHWTAESAEIHRKRADEVHGFAEPWHKVAKVSLLADASADGYHNPTDIEMITGLIQDKDEQAGRMMQMEEALKAQRGFLKLLNDLGGLGYEKHGWITSHIKAIDALLGGAEDGK